MRITVIAHPNTKIPRVEVDPRGAFHVYVHEPALGGKANQAVIEALARFMHKKKNQIHLLSGETSKTKQIEIQN